MAADKQIIVVGAGVVGVNIALALQRHGYDVRIIDRKGVCAETSAGNAGAFAFGDILPLATPSIMKKAPKWVLDPLGPLSIPPAYLIQILPWLYRFWRASHASTFHGAVRAQATLMQKTQKATEALIKGVDGEGFIQRDGQLQLYGNQKQYRESALDRKHKLEQGIKFLELKSADAIADIQPGVHSSFTHGIYTPKWMNVVDPKKWVEHLAKIFVSRGGTIEVMEAKSLVHSGNKPEIVTPSGNISASKIIVACGAWSHHLAKTIGDHIPLETERGYNTTLPQGAFDLKTTITFSNHGFIASKINGGVRIGGAVELAGLKLPPNYKRADHMLQKAKKFLPELDTQGGRQWMGFRPSLPDTLPVIDVSPQNKNIFYAFGHGHLGLTQSAATGQIIADLILQKDPDIDLSAFSAKRF